MFLSKNSFSKSKSSISSLLLFSVLVTQSIRINRKYFDGLTMSVHESMKCFTIEHGFTLFFMRDLKLESRGFQFSVDLTPCLPHFVQYENYIWRGACEISSDFNFFFVAEHSKDDMVKIVFTGVTSFHAIAATRILIYFF